MKTKISSEDLHGVIAVPPLARSNDGRRTINIDENDRLARHIAQGGITRLLYGGNAFLYHVTLREFEQLLDWLAQLPDELWAIPSIGPAYGRAMDQAAMLARYRFHCAMVLPCNDPRDARGLEQGLREIADAAGIPLVLYLKEENNFGGDLEAGLDVVARLVDSGVCAFIKYAVVRSDPRRDAYLEGLLKRVERQKVVSGMGERPAIVHMRDFRLPGFTTGSGCIAPRTSQQLYEACVRQDFDAADQLRSMMLPLEDLRDRWSPAKVLHYAMELAEVARTGPVPPYLTRLSEQQLQEIAPVARTLAEDNERG